MKRLSMRKIREALRLCANGLTLREIAESLGLGRTTIGDHLQRAARAGLTWLLDDALTDAEMDTLLFPPPSGVAATIAQPDWAMIHCERRRRSSSALSAISARSGMLRTVIASARAGAGFRAISR